MNRRPTPETGAISKTAMPSSALPDWTHQARRIGSPFVARHPAKVTPAMVRHVRDAVADEPVAAGLMFAEVAKVIERCVVDGTYDLDLAVTALTMEPRPAWVRELLK